MYSATVLCGSMEVIEYENIENLNIWSLDHCSYVVDIHKGKDKLILVVSIKKTGMPAPNNYERQIIENYSGIKNGIWRTYMEAPEWKQAKVENLHSFNQFYNTISIQVSCGDGNVCKTVLKIDEAKFGINIYDELVEKLPQGALTEVVAGLNTCVWLTVTRCKEAIKVASIPIHSDYPESIEYVKGITKRPPRIRIKPRRYKKI